jgi:SNF2 family DNA or RNA helicase
VERPSRSIICNCSRFGNWKRYTDKYGGPGEAPRNLDQLHEELKDIMIRRSKKEVLTELPDKQYNPIYVEMTASQRAEYSKLMKEVLKGWRAGLPSAAEMHAVQQFLLGVKMDAIIELNDEYLEQGEAVLNFCQYREPTKRLAEHYGKDAALIDGTLSAKARQGAVDRMIEGRAKVGCFTLFAAGEAIDGLQHVSTVVNHLNMYYVPWIHEQAEDRSHRQGQTKQVQVNYFIVEGTVDEAMWELLSERHKMISTLLDGKAPEEQVDKLKRKSFFKEFMQKVKKQMRADDIDENAVSEVENIKIVEE